MTVRIERDVFPSGDQAGNHSFDPDSWVRFKASRKTRGQKNAAISGTGWISGFVNETLLTYAQSTPTRMSTKTMGLRGEIEIKWEAFMVGNETMSEDIWLDLPFTVPARFAVGAVPMQLNIGARAQIVPTFIFEKSSSGGSFKLSTPIPSLSGTTEIWKEDFEKYRNRKCSE